MFSFIISIFNKLFNKNRGCSDSSGYMVSFNDICGPLSGIVYSIANTISSIAGFTAPFCVSLLTPNVS